MRALRAADERPVVVVGALLVVLYAGLEIWALLDDQPVLLAAARPDDREELYGQLAASAVTLLGIALTVLAILVALPDRPGVEDLRGRTAWPLLRTGLLATGALCLLCMATAHLATALDNAPHGKEWLSNLVIAAATAALIAVSVFGGAFWLALRRSRDPADPADVRAGTNPQ